MPPLRLARADRSIRAAYGLLGRPLPPGYPVDPETAYRDAPAGAQSWAIVGNVALAARSALTRAVKAERDARAAQEQAVRALRNVGAASPSWDRIGGDAGMTGQGAHRRYAAAADAPDPELTIDDELRGRSDGDVVIDSRP